MGLPYAPEYKWSGHFADRALERFGIDDEKLAKWVSRQRNTLSLYSNESELQPDTKKYVSDDGVVFVCNTVERIFVTCYEANDLLAEGKKVTIHENNVDSFKIEVTKLAHKYRLKDAQEMLSSVESHIEVFGQLSRQIMDGKLSEKNYQKISPLIDEFHAIKSAMKVIETRCGDFKC